MTEGKTLEGLAASCGVGALAGAWAGPGALAGCAVGSLAYLSTGCEPEEPAAPGTVDDSDQPTVVPDGYEEKGNELARTISGYPAGIKNFSGGEYVVATSTKATFDLQSSVEEVLYSADPQEYQIDVSWSAVRANYTINRHCAATAVYADTEEGLDLVSYEQEEGVAAECNADNYNVSE
jgi:hypothetical protein